MADKILVCVSARNATVAHWRGGRLTDCRVFSNDETGQDAFADFAMPYSGVPAYFMVDAVEEDYRFEALPHAFGSERTEMVRRKLRQHYRNTPYMGAWLVGRESGRRRDDRYLFSALTNPEIIGGWLRGAAARGMPVAGIFLLPLVSAAILGELRAQPPNLLLVSHHGGALRLTFFRDGQFRLSRLTRGDSGRAADRARILTEEISNTRIYLDSLRGARLDEHLTVLLLDHNDELIEGAGQIARDNPGLECIRIGPAELSSRLNIAEPLLRLYPDVIFLQLLARGLPANNLAPADVTVGFRRRRMRHAVYAAASAVALSTVVGCGINAWRTTELRAHIADAAPETARLQGLYQDQARLFPVAPTSAENLAKAVEISRKFTAAARTPEGFMRIVSKALEPGSNILVVELAWKHGVPAIEADSAGSQPQADPKSGVRNAADTRQQSGQIGGEIKPFHGDYRAAVDTVRAFADRLAADPGVAEVRIVKMPLDIGPAQALAGSTQDGREGPGAAQFRLLLKLKPNA